MPHFFLLGFEIMGCGFFGVDLDGNAFDDLESGFLESV
jgi:hypothetical protein